MTASTLVPFGVTVAARRPVDVEDVDLGALVYDAAQQLTLIHDGDTDRLVPWCKHSTGQTRVNTNTDGHQGPEYDTDHTED